MTHTLKISSKVSAAALVAMLALSGVASAEGVKVSFVGKSRQAVHGEVVQAARAVCEQAVASDLQDVYGSMDECVSATVNAAYAKINGPSNSLAMVRPSSAQSR